MQNHKTRLLAITGATLALVIASTAAVAAHGPRDDARGFGRGGGMGMDGWRGDTDGWQGDTDMPGMGARMGLCLQGAVADFERRETTIQTAEGTTSYRIEQGVVDATSDSGIDFTLPSGETVSVGMDDDTAVISFEEQTVTMRGWNRTRMLPTEVEPGDIEAGAEVMIWSTSEDGGAFLASRVVIQPLEDESVDDGTDDTDDSAAAAEETEAEAAASTDA
jgi:hypothetical protein